MAKVKDHFMDEIERNHREKEKHGLTEPREPTNKEKGDFLWNLMTGNPSTIGRGF